jgi:hypothetical protein
VGRHRYEEEDQIETEKCVQGHDQPMPRHSGGEPPEERRQKQERHEGGGHHPGQVLHPAFNRHFIANRTQYVVAAEETEKIEECPAHRDGFVRFCIGHRREHVSKPRHTNSILPRPTLPRKEKIC